MNLQRVCVHEAGHFFVAYRYRRTRAISVRISRQTKIDAVTGEEYVSVGHAVTAEPEYSLPRVQVSIRAAGLAAESLIYRESFEDLMGNPNILSSIKTDTDTAKHDLEMASLHPSTEAEFINIFWRGGFDDAVCLMRDSLEKVVCIANYCLVNLDRDIPKSELVEACDL